MMAAHSVGVAVVDSQRATGLPSHRVWAGSESPRMQTRVRRIAIARLRRRGRRYARQGDRVWAERRAPTQSHGVHPHDAVMEQVRLQHDTPVHRRAVAQGHQVGFREPVAFARHRQRARSGACRGCAARGSGTACRSGNYRARASPAPRRRSRTARASARRTRDSTAAASGMPGSWRGVSHLAIVVTRHAGHAAAQQQQRHRGDGSRSCSYRSNALPASCRSPPRR